MNPDVLLASPDDDAVELLARLAKFGVTGAPLVDSQDRLIGSISWELLVGARGPVGDLAVHPPVVVSPFDTVEHVACVLAETGQRRAFVAGADRIPVGVVATLDVVRALVGEPISHPEAFSHTHQGLVWSDPRRLRLDELAAVPKKAGLLVLARTAPGRPDSDVWTESCVDLQQRLRGFVQQPDTISERLRSLAASGELTFRFATTTDVAQRNRALRWVLYQAREKRRTERQLEQHVAERK